MAASSCVVTRAQFLARCPLSDRLSQPMPAQPNMTPASCPEPPPTLSPAQGLTPPPGLSAPPGLEEPTKALAPLTDPNDSRPPMARDGQHQVLLRDMPNDILREQMIRAMIQQANLHLAVVSFSLRPGTEFGEVILTLSNFAAAKQCVDHFHGCEWGASETPVTAHFVRVQEFAPEPTIAKSPAPKVLSVEAPTFVPSSTLSAEAAVFMPVTADEEDKRLRFVSDATTEAGLSSDMELSADAAVFMPFSADEKDKRPRFFSDATTEAGLSSDVESECCESEAGDWLKDWPVLGVAVA